MLHYSVLCSYKKVTSYTIYLTQIKLHVHDERELDRGEEGQDDIINENVPESEHVSRRKQESREMKSSLVPGASYHTECDSCVSRFIFFLWVLVRML